MLNLKAIGVLKESKWNGDIGGKQVGGGGGGAGSGALGAATRREPYPKRNGMRTHRNREASEAPVGKWRHLRPNHIEFPFGSSHEIVGNILRNRF